jgi:hypothetical protein
MAGLLGWDKAEQKRQLALCEEFLATMHTPEDIRFPQK